MMITQTFTHLRNSILCLMLFMTLGTSLFGQTDPFSFGAHSYLCECNENLAPGFMEFSISVWGDDLDCEFTIENSTNLLDASGNSIDGVVFDYVTSTTNGISHTFNIMGITDGTAATPTFDLYKNGVIQVLGQTMTTCRIPDYPVMPVNPSVCIGGEVNMTIDGGSSGGNVTWTASGMPTTFVQSGTNNQNVLISYAAAGTYTLEASGTSSAGCDYSFTNTVTVTDPTQGSVITGPTEFYVGGGCTLPTKEYVVAPISDGIMLDFNLVDNSGATPVTIATFSGGTTGSGTGSGTVNFDGLGLMSGTYDLVISNSSTAADACIVDGVSTSINIIDGPVAVDLGADVVLDHFCTGQAYDIAATVTPSSATNLIWHQVDCTTGAETLLDETGTTLTVTTAGCYRATLADCQDCAASDQIQVTYGDGVELDVDAAVTICSDALPYMLPAEIAGPWAVPITWYVQGGTIPVTQANAAGTYVAFVAENFACEQTDNLVLTVIDSPVVSLGEHDIFACEGGEVVLTAGPNDAYTYSWSHNGTIATGSVNVSETGTYKVTVTTLDGLCESIASVDVEFMDNPTVSFDNSSEVFCSGVTNAINATITGTTQVAWFYNNELIVGETNTSLDVTMAGLYTAIVGQGTDCEEEASLTVSFVDSEPVINGLSCVCLGSVNSYNLENFSNYPSNWVVCDENGAPLTSGFTLVPGANSDIVDITFDVAGNYILKNSGVSSTTPACSFSTSLEIVALEEDFSSIACNNQVNVTLNNDCQLLLLPEMILEGNNAGNDSYTVTITNSSGAEIDGNMLTQDLIGQILTVTVSQKCGDNSCWGEVLIEDKSIEPLGPLCNGGPFMTTCYEVDVPGNRIGFPAFDENPLSDNFVDITYRSQTNDWLLVGFDNCSDVVLSFIDDNTSSMTCSNPQTITRTWTVTDINNGATSSCSVPLLVELVDISSIQWPKNWDSALDTDADGSEDTDGICPSLELCGNFSLDEFGRPSPSHTGNPSGLVCTNLTVIGYEDQVIPGCGNTMKIVRTWTVWDACAEQTAMHNQTIVVMDSTNPICSAPATGSVSNNSHDCGATITVGPPSVNECSSWTYRIEYKLQYSNGDQSANFTSAGTHFDDATGNYTIADLPFDSDAILVRYIVTDDCGNVSTDDCTTEISLLDTEQPIPACDVFNTVTLNQFGLAYAGPSTFDDHSWDNCGIYQIAIQRMDTNTSDCDCEARTFSFMTSLGSYTNGHYYYISNGTTDAVTAAAYAAALGGTLASSESTAEADFIEAQVANQTNDAVHMSGTNVSGHARYVVEFDDKCGFTQTEKFCCEDVGDDIQMMLRVIDLAGNHNFCMANIRVVDFIRPVITNCPSNVTVECGTDINMNTLASVFGTIEASDECAVNIEESVSPLNLTDCNTGSFTRRWTVTDNSGNVAPGCTQTIRISDTDPFNESDIIWPEDYTVVGGCTLEGLDTESLPEPNREPIITAGGCSNVIFNYDDLVFYIVDGACQKMVRTWSVVDWCNPGNIYTYEQVFVLENTTTPVIDCRSSRLEISEGTGCNMNVSNLLATLNNNTACTENAIWSYSIEYDAASGVSTRNGTGNDASGSFPFGRHTITFNVEDACGNTAVCNRTINVGDNTLPSPYCHGELILPISQVSGVEIWASDLDLGSTDDCSGEVFFSFSESSIVSNLTLDCDNIGDNPVTLYVWDSELPTANKAFCVVNVIVQDNIGVCPLDVNNADISGTIVTENAEMVDQVEVSIASPNMSAPQFDMANNGEYAFTSLPMYSDYQVEAVKDDNYLNGVSTLDLVIIQRHILGIQNLDSPYKIIAADVNNSASVDGVDLVELRKLILGIYTDLPQNTSWRFVNSTHEFMDQMNPWPYEEDIRIVEFDKDVQDANFVGVKIGDVDQSATSAFQSAAVSNRNTSDYTIAIDKVKTDKGNTRIQFIATEDSQLWGGQFSLEHNAGELLAMIPMKVAVSDDNIAWNLVDENILRVSWNSPNSLKIKEGDILMEFLFQGNADVDFQEDISAYSEAYTGDINSLDVGQINFVNLEGFASEFSVMQNVPNPFKDETAIGFNLPQDGKVEIAITDLDGKLLNRFQGQYKKGYNEIRLSADQLNSSGVLYYQLTNGQTTTTRKMILIK